jgi:hypothetical protein
VIQLVRLCPSVPLHLLALDVRLTCCGGNNLSIFHARGYRSHIARAFMYAFVIFCGLSAFGSTAYAACPRSGSLAPRDPGISYKLRGNRCEGIYASNVSSDLKPQPKVIGFHRGMPPDAAFLPKSVTAFDVDLPKNTRGISIRAVSLRPKTYYAMDTELSAGTASFAWETSILSAPSLSMKASELGLLACNNGCLAARSTAYFPSRMLRPPAGLRSSSYEIIFQTPIGVDNVEVRLQPEGGASKPIPDLEDHYPPSWPISVPLGQLKSGRYIVRLSGTGSDGTQISGLYSIIVPVAVR